MEISCASLLRKHFFAIPPVDVKKSGVKVRIPCSMSKTLLEYSSFFSLSLLLYTSWRSKINLNFTVDKIKSRAYPQLAATEVLFRGRKREDIRNERLDMSFLVIDDVNVSGTQARQSRFFFVPYNTSSTLMRVLEGFALDFAVNGKLTSKCH